MASTINTLTTQSIRFGLVTLLVFGFGYVSLGVGLSQFVWPKQANGSLIVKDGIVIGSELVAQPFVSDVYFHSRPSASNYDLMSLAGSNQAQTNPALKDRILERMEQAKELGPSTPIPSDFLTQSGSSIDPHISRANANLQLNRVAKARHLSPEVVAQLVDQSTQGKQYWVFGQDRVNVLQLNLALDQLTTPKVDK